MYEAMTTDLEENVEDQRQIALNRQLEKPEDSAIECGHRAIGRNQAEVCLKKKKRIERAERKAARRDAHGEELEPRRAMEQAVEKLQERHRSP
jgi:hypothetical protein